VKQISLGNSWRLTLKASWLMELWGVCQLTHFTHHRAASAEAEHSSRSAAPLLALAMTNENLCPHEHACMGVHTNKALGAHSQSCSYA
jgi:hypothetical protein